jgi:transcription elongation GreA/GreB family factor
MDGRKFSKGEAIDIGALVELEHNGGHEFYLVASRAGGMDVEHEKQEVLIVTPQSPLGAQLRGKKQGDLLDITVAGTRSKYRVAKVL